jgi:predicted O-methyltransferase YrrM
LIERKKVTSDPKKTSTFAVSYVRDHMFFRIKSYLCFLLHATNQHGVHSPFVYDLLTKAMYQKSLQAHLDFYNQYQIQLSKLKANTPKNQQSVTVFGKNGLSQKKALLLMRLVDYFQPTAILELRALSGIGTSCMAFSLKKSTVISLENCVQNSEYLASNFVNLSLENIKLVAGDFQKNLPAAVEDKKYDFVFFNRPPLIKDRLVEFYAALNAIHNDSVFIFDAIYADKEMAGIWKKIKNHPQVKVTLDTYRFGVVFFRKEQVKQHFKIRG